jgi:PBS lyase HEAT-like repeat-containing protein
MRRSFLVVTLIVLAVAVALGLWLSRQRTETTVVPQPAEPQPTQEAGNAATPPAAPMPQEQPAAVVPSPAPTVPTRPAASPETRQLVAALTQIKGPITPELAALWKSNLTQLVQQGPAAILAIREFLEQNKDIPYDYKQGGDLLGAHSLRLALLQALEAIGGAEAMQLALDTLQTTTQPREIAQIAQHLEKQAEGQYREAILHAARESLAMAAGGKLGQIDPGPLFNVLARYAGADAVPDLQKVTSPFRYYSAIALAQLPDGSGIPALAQMLRQPNGPPRGTHNAALEALAQLVPDYPEARDRLMEQATLKQIPETLWPSIADSLTGAKFSIGNLAEEGLSPASGDKTYHLAQGPQNFYSRPNLVQFTPEQKQQLSQFIDQLLQTQVPALGLESLQKAKEKLAPPPAQ